ncbi:MAG: citrate lyase acyl carrier protein [Spirochaetia bacterium]|nr:citrate lyase acyl carrier protein [Spirochaetia bacterium]
MELIRTGKAGTLESSDVLISVKTHPENKIEIKLKSIVEKRFGKHIEQLVRDILDEMQVSSALVDVDDRSALDCVIRARLETALYRGAGVQTYHWEAL